MRNLGWEGIKGENKFSSKTDSMVNYRCIGGWRDMATTPNGENCIIPKYNQACKPTLSQ